MSELDVAGLVFDALGKPIFDPAAERLAAVLGSKGFKPCTPNANDRADIKLRKRLGVEIGTSMNIPNRELWPPRKLGRVWLTYVSHAFFYPNYAGALPEGFSFAMDDSALSARFPRRIEGAIGAVRFHLPPPRAGIKLTAELGQDGRPWMLYGAVEREADYVSMYPDAPPEFSVEAAFFVVWAVRRGLVRAGRLSADEKEAIRQRRDTPLATLRDIFGGLFWETDVEPAHRPFCQAYHKRLPPFLEHYLGFDAKQTFGEANAWRRWNTPHAPMTEDSWANYDRMAPLFDQRLEQWRRSEMGVGV